jgi:hypothetical protein
MKIAFAPRQLPFAQRPFANELFSSWLMRIADANCVSLEELMLGFQCRHPEVACPASLDWDFPQPFLKTMARFCRTSCGSLRALDLRTRLPDAETALLLRSKAYSDQCPRLRDKRTGYAFCPNCITEQPYVHVRWEWAFPALLRCHVHKSPLRHGCPLCGEDDPLPFGTAPLGAIPCQSCGANLRGSERSPHVRHVEGAHVSIERIYRAALLGAAPRPALLGQTTGTQFRRFVDDLLQLLAWYPNPELSPRLTDPRNQYLPFRTEMLAIVGALVRNAAPESKPNRRQIKYREGLRLWLSVLSLLSRREEAWIETASERWPSALRRRLRAALQHHERASAQRSPFRSTFFRPGLKYINRFEFRDLRTVKEVERRMSGI